jgi:hypothetical protein
MLLLHAAAAAASCCCCCCWRQVSLPNGLQVYLLEDHEVPLIKGTLLMAGGQTASPGDQVGDHK